MELTSQINPKKKLKTCSIMLVNRLSLTILFKTKKFSLRATILKLVKRVCAYLVVKSSAWLLLVH
jgi:hypothetical protein